MASKVSHCRFHHLAAGYSSTFSHSLSTFSVTFSHSLPLLSPVFCIFVTWDSLSCLVGVEGLELPISAQLVRQEQQLLRQWFPQLFRIREQGWGVWASGAPRLHRLHSRGLRLQRLWPVAPLFHWRSCATSWSIFRDSSVLI